VDKLHRNIQAKLLIGGFLALLLGGFTCSKESTVVGPSKPPPTSYKDMLDSTFGGVCWGGYYVNNKDIECTDTLMGYVSEHVPFEREGIELDSTGVYHLWKIGQRLFAVMEGGDLWSKIHGTNDWELLAIPNSDLAVLPKPFFKYEGQDYLLTRKGRVYLLNQNGVGVESNMKLPSDWCMPTKTCYYSKINEYKTDLYVFVYMGYWDEQWDTVSTFLYKSSDKGLNWSKIESFGNRTYVSLWEEYDGYAYINMEGSHIYRFDGEKFDSLWYMAQIGPDSNHYFMKSFNYQGLLVLDNILYIGGSSRLLKIKGLDVTKVFDGYATHTTMDTVCGAIVNVGVGEYWRPGDMPIDTIRPVYKTDNTLNGYRKITDNEDGVRYLTSVFTNQRFSPVRMGDTLYFGAGIRKRDGKIPRPGGVTHINLRNVKICKDAWERGETIGGRTRPKAKE